MQVDFSKLGRNALGDIEAPLFVLMKPHEEVIGVLGRAFAASGELKYSELSSVKFTYPKYDNGDPVLFYEDISKDRLVKIDPYGIFVIASAEEVDDGVRAVKSVELYSREYELATKRVVFKEGTYNLWNPADQENTMLYMALAEARNWNVGYVSPSLIGRYRTFDQTDAKTLEFLQSKAQESYGCVFVFDTYQRTVNAYDVDEDVALLPIYLSHDNLLKEKKIKELEEDFPTQFSVHGAEGVDIRGVNPTGDNYIYNLDYCIGRGDLPATLATKWVEWQNSIFATQQYYTSLVCLRNAADARYITENARLTDLKNERASLENIRIARLQLQQQHPEAYEEYAKEVEDLSVQIGALDTQIASQEELLESIEAEANSIESDISDINQELKMSAVFSADELNVLDNYLKQDDFVDNTFAVFDVTVSAADNYTSKDKAELRLTDVTWVDVECDGEHRIGMIKGGSITITGSDYSLTANVVSGTIDHKDSELVSSFYLGAGTVNGESFTSANLSCVGSVNYDDDALLSGMEKREDVKTNADSSVSHISYYYVGSPSISVSNAALYFTRNVTDYQRYSVSQDLYDYAHQCIQKLASPTYEFDVESGNILYAKEFEPFKNALRLGCRCYLQVDDTLLLTPVLIEVHVDFDDPSNFSLVFANQFRRPDAVNSLKDIIKDATSASRSFDNSKFAYGENNNTTTWVKSLLDEGYSAAMAQIMAGDKNLVTIDQAGIKISSEDGVDTIQLNNGMIALIDRRTNTVKMAMGHFMNPANGADFVGVLADVIGGTLLAGQNLIIECPDPNGGVMQFKVDSSGVILNNGRMYLKSNAGAIGLDAKHGFFAGTKELFDLTDTGYVSPVCVDAVTGSLILDDDGFPKDTNMWIGIDGKAYFRGKIYATDGVFRGTVYANAGEFKGIVQASDFLDTSGKSMLSANGKFSSSYLDLGNIQIDGTTGNISMTGSIDMDGSISLKGDINLSQASSINFGGNTFVKVRYSTNKSATIPSGWTETWNSSWTGNTEVEVWAIHSYDGGATWVGPSLYQGKNGLPGQNGSDATVPAYITKTVISEGVVAAPEILANDFTISPYDSNDTSGSFTIYGNYNSTPFKMFAIDYIGGWSPDVYIYSTSGAKLYWGYNIEGSSDNSTNFYGYLDFSGCESITWGDHAPEVVTTAVWG